MLQDGLPDESAFFDVCEFFSEGGLSCHLAYALRAGCGGRLSEAGQNGGRRGPLPLEMAQADDEFRPLDLG